MAPSRTRPVPWRRGVSSIGDDGCRRRYGARRATAAACGAVGGVNGRADDGNGANEARTSSASTWSVFSRRSAHDCHDPKHSKQGAGKPTCGARFSAAPPPCLASSATGAVASDQPIPDPQTRTSATVHAARCAGGINIDTKAHDFFYLPIILERSTLGESRRFQPLRERSARDALPLP